jgi:hypothetical protein
LGKSEGKLYFEDLGIDGTVTIEGIELKTGFWGWVWI